MRQESQQPLHETAHPDWMHVIGANLGRVRPRSKYLSIYRVPNKLRQVNEEAYSPRMVSIGPLHHEMPDLLAMKEHKWRYMLSLFHRTKTPIDSFKLCAEAIANSKEMAQGYYPENIDFEKDCMLEEMLLVDGCFILELFIRHWYPEYTDESDPILNNTWMIPALQHDLALLENQIPFFVLKELFQLILGLLPESDRQILPPSVTPLALSFFYPELKGETIKWERIPDSSHLLHLLHNFFYLPVAHKAVPQDKKTWGFRRCATKLLEAGIQFEKGASETNRLLEVEEGSRPGVIKIPPLSVDRTTGSRLRNLIALEQCSIGSTHKVTSYGVILSSLIHSSEDIQLLERRGIIINNLGTGEDVWPHLDGIRKEVVPKDFYYSELCERVNAYSKSRCRWLTRLASWGERWRKYLRALKHDYFANPWSIISFIAAVLLLLSTGLQVVYSALQYYNH